LNDGAGGFEPGVAWSAAGNNVDVALGDLDGNGALDLVQGKSQWRFGEQSLIYWNTGRGEFSAGTPFGDLNKNLCCIAVGDMNGDGALDIIQGNTYSPTLIYLLARQTDGALA